MSPPPGAGAALLALLVAGHAVGDFVFQTRAMVREKRRPAVLLRHAAAVAAAHLLLLVPFLSWPVAIAAGALGLAHGAVDGVKARIVGDRRDGVLVFLADQAVHAATVVGAWLVLRGMAPGAWLLVGGDLVARLYVAGVLVTGFAFVGNGGSGLVRGVLSHLEGSRAELDDSGLEGSGHLIGILERLLGLVLVLMGEWAALSVLLAAKSIARFEELRDRPFAEYYLVGTLASLLVAVLVGLALQLVLP